MKIELVGLEPVLDMLDDAERLEDDVAEIRSDVAYTTQGKIINLAPVDTGWLKSRQSIHLIDDLAIFINYAKYARFVGQGTGQAGAASYKAYLPGETAPTYASYWPGMAAIPFMRPPIAEALNEFDRRIEDLADGIGA